MLVGGPVCNHLTELGSRHPAAQAVPEQQGGDGEWGLRVLLANWRRIARKRRQRPYAFLLHVDTRSAQAPAPDRLVGGQPFTL